MNSGRDHPLIFDIRHFSLDDGPGIRTTVYLKGCPLACLWCQNPESQAPGPEIAYYSERCIGCGDCEEVCGEKAINPDDQARVLRDRCTACGACVEVCPTAALKKVGRYYAPGELMEILLADREFYRTSNGGVTFSGGEPTLFMPYVGAIMRELKRHEIHVALQTAGVFDLSKFKRKLLPYLDLIYYDIKVIARRRHKALTGLTNEGILDNFKALYRQKGVKVIPRVPLVPGLTATPGNLSDIAGFLRQVGCPHCELLSYNPTFISKRTALDQDVPRGVPQATVTREVERALRTFFAEKLNGPSLGDSVPAK